MCGIFGVWEYQNKKPVVRSLVKQQTQTMAHRGPDDEGFIFDDLHGLGLGFRRLSIIDLSPAGHQPMSNEDGSIWLVFNGEIYNFAELRPQLEAAGHTFRSQTDSEVILHLYEEYGEGCISRLNGMFALAIWDSRKQRLLLARDRVGKKPLYYYDNGQRIIFASELKAILADASVPREMDYQALSEYLAFGYISSPNSILCNIHKLEPGNYLCLEKGQATIHRYWDWLPAFQPDGARSTADWIEEIRYLLKTIVRDRLVSDVPLGAFLSGGIDSSAVVATMAELASGRVKTFAIGFEEDDFNELKYARIVADYFSTDHEEHVVQPEALQEILPRLVTQFDEPFADSSAIPTYYVAKIARQKVTVALSGDGGDEALAGYSRYPQALSESRVDVIPYPVRHALLRLPASLIPLGGFGQRFAHRMTLTAHERYTAAMRLIQERARHEFMTEEAAHRMESSGTEGMEAALRKAANLDLLSRIQYADSIHYLPEDILVKVDRMSMLNSLEVRCPLLDHRFLEAMAKVPPGLRLRDGRGKYIFVEALRGKLPEEILNRPKQGFNMPLCRWFRGELASFAEEILLDPRTMQRGLWKPEKVQRMLKQHQQQQRTFDATIWSMLVLELWYRQVMDVPAAEQV